MIMKDLREDRSGAEAIAKSKFQRSPSPYFSFPLPTTFRRALSKQELTNPFFPFFVPQKETRKYEKTANQHTVAIPCPADPGCR